MPKARKEQISISDTPCYHCISRCVRRAFLYGVDPISGKNYEHRKQWIADKLAELAHIFAIEVYAYSVMANHTHLVLKINTELGQSWSEQQVMQRWHTLFSLPILIERYQKGECKTTAEQNRAKEIIEVWRQRLTDISWFMRCLNEFVARKANAEDKCTGRFWEGRFKSQALLTEQALLACMSYVDLNPVRANISDSLENSDYTSIQQRIKQLENKPVDSTIPVIPLAPFIAASQTDNGIPFALKDYLELTDWTGRCVREDKRGYIKPTIPAILTKLNIDESTWIETVQGFTEQFHSFVGSEKQLAEICKKQNKKWLGGINLCRKLFSAPQLCPS